LNSVKFAALRIHTYNAVSRLSISAHIYVYEGWLQCHSTVFSEAPFLEALSEGEVLVENVPVNYYTIVIQAEDMHSYCHRFFIDGSVGEDIHIRGALVPKNNF